MKAIVIIVTALMLLTPCRDKSNSRTVSIPDLTMRTTAIAQPVYSGVSSQLYANDCVPAAFARAGGVSFTTLYAKINDLYRARALDNVPQEVYDYSPNAYPFDVLRMTPTNAIIAMNALGYSVIATEASPDVLVSVPRGSVFVTPGWGHAYNIVSYDRGSDTMVAFSGSHNAIFHMADFAVMRAVGQPTEPYREELHYPDVFIVR